MSYHIGGFNGYGYGGYYYGNVRPDTLTSHYINLIKRADARSENPNGRMSHGELQLEIQNLNQKKQLLEQLCSEFEDFQGGYFTQIFNYLKQQVVLMLRVANRANTNFAALARPYDDSPANDVEVEEQEVKDVANRDQRIHDVSDSDLGLPATANTSLFLYEQYFGLADKKGNTWGSHEYGDGKLTKVEIEEQITRDEDYIDQLEELKDDYPEYWHPYIDKQIEMFEQRVAIGNRMFTHFNALDNANADGTLDGFIERTELRFAANRDYWQYDLSDEDLLIA